MNDDRLPEMVTGGFAGAPGTSQGCTLLTVERGRWGYRTGNETFFPACEIDFTVQAGEIVLLAGANGTGKTTILRGLLGLVPGGTGTVTWGISRSDVGYVPQESVVDRSIPATVSDIVRTGDPQRWRSSRADAQDVLRHVGMAERQSLLFSHLSGGQRQRVLIARALTGRPRLLLLDEPTINVDAAAARQIGDLLVRLGSEGIGMVVTSHVVGWVSASREIVIRTERGGYA